MATQTEEFLRTHPLGGFDHTEELSTVVERLAACAQACTACADACLGERDASGLADCIRLNQDCADVCAAAERVLSRRTGANKALDAVVLRAAADFCAACARMCGHHAERYEHCRLCADTCMLCEDACRKMLTYVG